MPPSTNYHYNAEHTHLSAYAEKWLTTRQPCPPSQNIVFTPSFMLTSSYLLLCCCSITESCPTLCDSMDCSMPGSSVLQYLPEMLKFISIELVILSNHLILSCPLFLLPSIFPNIRAFSSELAFPISGQSIGASASVLVLPMNIQD